MHSPFDEAQNSPLAQSPSPVHAEPAGQGVGQLPPQSTADSSPLRTASSHAPPVQTPSEQRCDVQSTSRLQGLPAAQAIGHPPPQSTAVSRPFLDPSVQLGSGSGSGQPGPGHSDSEQELRSSPPGQPGAHMPFSHTSSAPQSLAVLQQRSPAQPAPPLPAPLRGVAAPPPAPLSSPVTSLGSNSSRVSVQAMLRSATQSSERRAAARRRVTATDALEGVEVALTM